MPQVVSPEHIEIDIQGDVTGQVAVGNNILQIGSIHGGVVYVAAQPPEIRPLSTPVSLLPPPFPNFLDRTKEISDADAAVRSAMPIEFYGQHGIGKTTLLRHLAYAPFGTVLPDGIVYLGGCPRPVDDWLQFLFDAFYASDVPFKATDAQICRALQNKQALVLIDDEKLTQDEVETLRNAAPRCTFLLASLKRRLWGEGRAVPMRGLPPDDALLLVERELERSLTPMERPAAEALCAALEGHPLSILRSVAMVREDGLALDQVARRVQSSIHADEQSLAVLSKPERQILAVLAVAGDAPLHVDHIVGLSQVTDAVPLLEKLLRRGLVKAHGQRFSLVGTLGRDLRQQWNLASLSERAVAYFIAWAEGHEDDPRRLLEDVDVTMQVLEWAVSTGRWADVLRLGRAVEEALALGKRWRAWAQVLQWVLQAAQVLGDQMSQAWALHQDGTRALCLGNAVIARDILIKALRLREALGDLAGAAVTRHNLDFVLPPPPPASESVPPPMSPLPVTPMLTVATISLVFGVTAVLIVAILGFNVLQLGLPSLTPTPTTTSTVLLFLTTLPTESNTATPAFTATLTPMPSPTTTPTATSTGTPTPTDTPPPTATPQSTATPCPCSVPPADWTPYTVQANDTIYSLARTRMPGTSVALAQLVEQIAYYNCLCPGAQLRFGQRMYLPPFSTPTSTTTPLATFTSIPTFTPTPTFTDTPTPTPTPTNTPTHNPPPAAPSSMNAVADPPRVYLNWQDIASDESAYHIERREDKASWVEIGVVEADTTAYTDNGVCGITYSYRARAYRASDGQYSAYSDVVSVAWACPLAPPSKLIATQVSSQRRINLSWQDNASNESNYRIYRSPDGNTNWVQIYTTASDNVTAYTDSGLDCYTTYYYRVRAYRASDEGYSEYSNLASDTTKCSDPVATILQPADGTSFNFYYPSRRTVTFTGDASDPEDSDNKLAVEWFSDVDGFLGSGQSIIASLSFPSFCNSSLGLDHKITLQVTDSDGNVSKDTIEITIIYWGSGCW